ncbi:MAG TPA: acyltransferase [Actinomycetota bacterium]|nr:acyltransferase [Actinomycetota bacterium]
MGTRLDELAARTPATRDRSVDLLRAASIVTVVLGHWFISINHWEGGLLTTTSAIGVTPWMWLGTWVFQVMPIFFFVGGFSNLVTYRSFRRRGEPTATFVRTRVERLLRPSLVFLGTWLVVQVALHLADVGRPAGPVLWGETTLLRGVRPPAATLPFGPLWFLAVYLVVVAISPLTIRLHERFRWWVPAALLAGSVATDAVGFGLGIHGARYANVAFVLLLPHQLGHLYADGTFARLPRAFLLGMVVAGLGALILLTNPWAFQLLAGDARFRWFPTIGHYPRSLLGTDVEPISNAYPPTVCYVAVGIWTIGAAMLLRERLTRWLERPRPWKATIFVNSVIMTLFLWHMTAYLLAMLVLWPLGFGREQDATARWWLERPLWLLGPGLVLAGIVALVGRFERPRGRAAVPAARRGGPEEVPDARPVEG